MLEEDNEKPDQLVESAVEQVDKLSIKPMIKKRQALSNDNKKPHLIYMTESYGSRGSVMLKAALAADNKNRQPKSPTKRNYCPVSEEQKKARLKKHAEELKSRRRSPKNKVLFTEPVVSKEYEYEQTLLIENDQQQQQQDSDSSEDNQVFFTEPVVSRECDYDQTSLIENEQQQQDNDSSKEIPMSQEDKPNQENDEVSRDLRDGIKLNKVVNRSKNRHKPTKFTTLIAKDEINIYTFCRRGLRKRTYDVAMKEDGELSETSLNGSLFSSPKVAKIAPYYHSQNDCGKQLLKQASSDNNLTDNENQNNLSLLNNNASIQHNSESSGPHHTVLSWFTTGLSYLSSQMNKLIF